MLFLMLPRPPLLQVVERRSSELRAGFTSTTDVLAGDVDRMAQEGAAVAQMSLPLQAW